MELIPAPESEDEERRSQAWICASPLRIVFILLLSILAVFAASRGYFERIPPDFGMDSMDSFARTLHSSAVQVQQQLKVGNNSSVKTKTRVCVVSAMLGNYEKFPKGRIRKSSLHSMFMVVDEHSKAAVENSTLWTAVMLDKDWWMEDCYRFQDAGNNPCETDDPFLLAKFPKTQPHRLPVIRDSGCDIVVWMDASLELHHKNFFNDIVSLANNGSNFAVFPHTRSRQGEIYTEAKRSVNAPKYNGQDLSGQYSSYIQQGFKEHWFDNHTFIDKFGNRYSHKRDVRYGMFVTCMVLFDLRRSITRKFLDCWWRETVRWSTQDQMSFPFCAWDLGVDIAALPDGNVLRNDQGDFNNNKWFQKMKHGKR